MPMSNPNPRRNNQRLAKEKVGRPRAMATIKQIEYRDPECLLHVPNPFDALFPANRPLDELDYADLDGLCTCRYEHFEGDGSKRHKERKPKVCPVCRVARAANGSCFCC